MLSAVGEHPRDVARVTAERFGISRQAVAQHTRTLVADGLLLASGRTRDRYYELVPLVEDSLTSPITRDVSEDQLWRGFVCPLLGAISERGIRISRSAMEICEHGFCEILSNAIEHSEGTAVLIAVRATAASLTLAVADDGVGVFTRIKRGLGLADERQAVLELAKGKLTTDPEGHTGDGVFLTSRMFDRFSILADGIVLAHAGPGGAWRVEARESGSGTQVIMGLSFDTRRTRREVLDRCAPGQGEYGFSRTDVPVTLVRYGDESLVSRTQARRLVARLERFREVLLDFAGVASVGQAFADEVFRVFPRQNPHVALTWANANEEVERAIRWALNAAGERPPTAKSSGP